MIDDNKYPPRPTTEIVPLAIRRLEKLHMGLPPRQLFDDPLGCPVNRRLVAFYWVRAIRAPMLHDGFLERVGNPEPYRIWRHHPQVIPHLTDFNLGDTAEQAGHWLLLDRLLRLLYVGKAADVREGKHRVSGLHIAQVDLFFQISHKFLEFFVLFQFQCEPPA